MDPDARIPGCGDGILDEGEWCDDGNTVDYDGCTAECLIEGDGCPVNITCPPPGPGRVSVCGRLYNLEDSSVLDDGSGTASLGVEVRFHDPLAFVSDPGAYPPILTTYVDNCGVYKAEVPNQPSNLIAVTTDDYEISADDLYQITAHVFPTAVGQTYTNVITWITRQTTMGLWDTSAGRPSGQGFGVIGAYVSIFLEEPGPNPIEPFDATPAAGTQITEGTTADPARSYVFGDAEPHVRRTIDPMQSTTGPNGTAIMIETGLLNHGGIGGEPPGCSWPSTLGAAIEGVIFVQARYAECP